MTIAPPNIDKRTAAEVLRDIRSSMPSWYQEAPGEFNAALLQICAYFGEQIIHRLNRAPEKNFLAFLDLLGISPLFMEAARVPLTFSLAPGSVAPVPIPAGTLVAAPPAKGDQRPILFETERKFFATPARLDSLFYKDGTKDRYADLSSAVAEPSGPQSQAVPEAAPVVCPGLRPIPHLLYIALPLRCAVPKIDRLCLNFTVERTGGLPKAPLSLQWEIPGEVGTTPAAKAVMPAMVSQAEPALATIFAPSADGTRNLAESGSVVFLNASPMPITVIAGIPAVWIACRLLTPSTSVAAEKRDTLDKKQLPVITDITTEVELSRKELALDHGFANTTKLDLTKDFLPFGERPKFGDTFYFAHREAFSDPDAEITLHVDLAGSAPPPDSTTSGGSAATAQLGWEFWDGQKWKELGISGRYLRMRSSDENAVSTEFSDETESLSKSGEIRFRFNRPPAELNLNGVKNYWLRARILAGDYGRESQLQRDPATGGPRMTPPTLAPPIIRSLRLDYALKLKSQPKAIVTCNDFSYVRVDLKNGPFRPFRAVAPEDALPALYLGFSVGPQPATKPAVVDEDALDFLPVKDKFPDGPISAYILLSGSTLQRRVSPPGNAGTAWEYWNGEGWKKFAVTDDTLGFQRSGLIEFFVAGDFIARQEFGRHRFWLRMRQGALECREQIRNIYLNTTMAIRAITVLNDILGSSTGKPEQKFRTTQSAVLPHPILDVREPTLPPAHEQAHIREESGESAIQPAVGQARKTQFWVRWKEVANFYGSKPRDRHYVLDHVSGEVSFGDGVYGMIPPVLDGNIRMTCYRSGGGTAGNVPAQAIKQLVSAVPSVQKVTNWITASGGTDPETTAALLRRGPREIRHRGRAVTAEDYEDLALLASRQVARAKGVALRDLKADPDGRRQRSGTISLVIVPNSAEARPMPDNNLLDRVYRFLNERRSPLGELMLVAPEYVCIDVKAEIVVERSRFVGDVEGEARRQLDQYLHPVSGGIPKTGWEFGRLPQNFDLYMLLERIPGVSHVRHLRVEVRPCRPGAERTGWFLACSGRHDITMRVEEEEYASALA